MRDYERALRSRNLLLKAPSPRWREIAAFDEPLLAAGQRVTAARARLLAELQPEADAAHHAISGAREKLRARVCAGRQAKTFPRRSRQARKRRCAPAPDERRTASRRRALSRSTSSRRDFASEGQQRTLVLALKLGAARLLARHFGAPPVLLLDDIFGELDLTRRAALLAALPADAQKLITTTHLDWLPAGLEAAGAAARLGRRGGRRLRISWRVTRRARRKPTTAMISAPSIQRSMLFTRPMIAAALLLRR